MIVLGTSYIPIYTPTQQDLQKTTLWRSAGNGKNQLSKKGKNPAIHARGHAKENPEGAIASRTASGRQAGRQGETRDLKQGRQPRTRTLIIGSPGPAALRKRGRERGCKD